MDNLLYKKLCSLDVLKRAWHLVRNDARTDFIYDSYNYSDFGFDLENNLKNIIESLLNEKYYPKPLLEIDVPKSSLAVRPGSVPHIEDRIVTYAIIYLIAPYLDKRLPNGVYSYRLKSEAKRDRIFKDNDILEFPFLKKKTILQRIDIIEPWYEQWPTFIKESKYSFEIEKYNFLVISDIVSYFENIHLEVLRDEILIKHLPKEQKIINLLMNILEHWTWRSCEGKQVLRGIPQGNEVSSFLGNIYLLPMDEEFIKFSRRREIKYFRYMDDVKIFAKNEQIARECIFVMNNILRKLHLNIQGEKTLILTGSDIKDDIEDERMNQINNIINSLKEKKTLSLDDKKEIVNKLIQQYKKIKTRRRVILKKDLRVFRRLVTAFTMLKNPYLVNRTLKQIMINPDYKLLINTSAYFRLFPKKEIITKSLTSFLLSKFNNFELQEANVLSILRYRYNYPKKLITYAKKIIKNNKKHWYVRVQGILLLNNLKLSTKELYDLLNQFNSEQNVEIKRVLIKPLCQLKKDELLNFFKKSIFDRRSRIVQVIRMLFIMYQQEDKAISEVNSLFKNLSEHRLLDEYYKLEVIKFSKSECVRKKLQKELKNKRRFIKNPILLKKLDETIKFLSKIGVS